MKNETDFNPGQAEWRTRIAPVTSFYFNALSLIVKIYFNRQLIGYQLYATNNM